MSKNKECCDTNSIISEFYDRILGYVIKHTNDVILAEDITQEVMGRLVDAYNNDVDVKNIKAWLFQVTRNIISDRYRKREIVEFDDLKVNETSSDDSLNLMAEDFIVPMINLLPEDYRVPLFMSDIENVKQADIAKKLKLTLSATKMRCQRARKMLYQLFMECCDIEYTESGTFAHCTIKQSCTPLNDIDKELKTKE